MKVCVLCGGFSREREVSLASGRRAAEALRRLGHRAALVDMYLGLEGFEGPADAAFDLPLPPEAGVPEAEPDLDALRAARRLRSAGLFGERVLEICAAADAVFLALHGGCGEDGRVQAAFDLLGIRYTGSGSLGCALAMDKRLTKLLASRAGVRTPEWEYLAPGCALTAAPAFGPPWVVKPANSGSSIGVEAVRSMSGLPAAVERAAAEGGGVLIERRIAGREIQLSVLNGRPLPSIEILPEAGFYDYRSKYQPGAAREVTPADVPPETEERAAGAALKVYGELGLRGLARADFILDGAGELWFLEINALPGLTPTSLAPQEAAAAGMSYEELCRAILEEEEG